MPVILTQRYTISVGDTDVIQVDYTDRLRSGELLVQYPTVEEVTTTDLTLENKIVNTATFVNTINGRVVPIGHGVQFRVSGGKPSNSPYKIRVTVSTDGVPTRTMVRDLLLDWD